MEYFTWQWLATVAGAVAATQITTTILADRTGWDARWLALAVAMVIQILVWAVAGAFDPKDLALALLNGFVVYLGASGGNAIAASRVATRGAAAGAGSRRWW